MFAYINYRVVLFEPLFQWQPMKQLLTYKEKIYWHKI